MYIFTITLRIQREIVTLQLSLNVSMVIENIVHPLNFNIGVACSIEIRNDRPWLLT
jgi:hypothetical protein